jgi:uncharacterized membrane protein
MSKYSWYKSKIYENFNHFIFIVGLLRLVRSIFCTQKSASSISGFIELLVSLSILPPQLKADSKATVLGGIAWKSQTIDDNI